MEVGKCYETFVGDGASATFVPTNRERPFAVEVGGSFVMFRWDPLPRAFHCLRNGEILIPGSSMKICLYREPSPEPKGIEVDRMRLVVNEFQDRLKTGEIKVAAPYSVAVLCEHVKLTSNMTGFGVNMLDGCPIVVCKKCRDSFKTRDYFKS